MEEIWNSFAFQLEQFEEYCIDARQKMEPNKIQKSSLDGLFTNVLVTVIKDQYDHLLVSELEVSQGQDATTQVNILEVQNQKLVSEIDGLHREVEDMTKTIKYLEGQNLQLEHQLQSIHQQYQAREYSRQHNVFGKNLGKLINAQWFDVVQSDLGHSLLVLFKKKKIVRQLGYVPNVINWVILQYIVLNLRLMDLSSQISPILFIFKVLWDLISRSEL